MHHVITADAIREGLTRGEFFLEYLPTISLADGVCVGAEALTRWRRPHGLVSPAEFIHIVEDTPLSGTLTYWVIETVAAELGDWLEMNGEAHISINVPPEILGRGGVVCRRKNRARQAQTPDHCGGNRTGPARPAGCFRSRRGLAKGGTHCSR